MAELIDTTEMYLRTVYELEEEGIPPLRARIAERLGHSGPTVSQTVARMERDGLLEIGDDRQLKLTQDGLQLAARVMRKHRLAERLLADVIGLEWPQLHDEACRWEHVMSEQVEEKLIQLLDTPERSPFGNLIPGLEEFQNTGDVDYEPELYPGEKLTVALDEPGTFEVLLLTEAIQTDPEVLELFVATGIRPGSTIEAEPADGYVAVRAIKLGPVPAGQSEEYSPEGLEISAETAEHLRVKRIS